MDGFYRYTLMDVSEGDPETTFLDTDPAADPSLGWVQVPFDGLDEVKTFEILIYDAPVGPSTTLTVSVRDEALADTRFQYSWEVREPAGPILYVADSAGPLTKTFYRDFLSSANTARAISPSTSSGSASPTTTSCCCRACASSRP